MKLNDMSFPQSYYETFRVAVGITVCC